MHVRPSQALSVPHAGPVRPSRWWYRELEMAQNGSGFVLKWSSCISWMLKETTKWNLFFCWFPENLVTFCPSLTSNYVRPSRNFDEVPSGNGRRLNFHSALVFESYHSFTIIAWTHYNNCSSFNRILLVIQKSKNCHFYWCPSLTHEKLPWFRRLIEFLFSCSWYSSSSVSVFEMKDNNLSGNHN